MRYIVTQFAKEVGYVKAKLEATATTASAAFSSVDYDAAVKLAYRSSTKNMSFDAFKARYLLETSEMVAKKNPYVVVDGAPPAQPATHQTLTSVDYDAAARLAFEASIETVPFDTFKAKYLLETSAMVAKKNPYIQGNIPAPPTHDISAESFMKQPMIKIVTKRKVVKPKPNATPASPLARLLAEELGLELSNIGRGSGKNGKILIDDVRLFQSKIEKARDVISKKHPYFATANA